MSGLVVLLLRLMLAVSLYAFLILGFITLWRDIKQQGSWFPAEFLLSACAFRVVNLPHR
jgi:hypothetical protein